jgi:hypothetical protein
LWRREGWRVRGARHRFVSRHLLQGGFERV